MQSIYPWHSNSWKRIEKLIIEQRLPHAILLYGAADSGKFRFSEVLAETLLCKQHNSGIACGFCKQCLLVKAGNHPDLKILQPEGKGQIIPIDRIRGLIDFAAKTAQQGGWKVVVINKAERLNTHASNALLKILEEPPENTAIILVSNDIAQVIPTIKSRCRQFAFSEPLAAEVIPWLTEALSSEASASEALASAQNRPLLALRMLQDGLLEKRRTIESGWQQVSDGSLSPIRCAEQCSKLEPLAVMDWFYYFLSSQIKTVTARAVQRNLFKMLDALSEARRVMESGTNPNELLMWEELMLDWRAVSRT